MPRISNSLDSHKNMIKRTNAYGDQVGKEFDRAVNRILALNKMLPTLESGVMFSFDDVSNKKRNEVERALRELHSAVTLAIEAGIRTEWAEANKAADELVAKTFGKAALDDSRFAAYCRRNTEARDAFIARSNNGMNLSQRIWQHTRRLRDEMEVAMTVAIGEGMSASNMSRLVRKYLNDPELMFRRFRYKDENGNWQKKWKKAVRDEQGRKRWVDYDKDSYKVGRGVYKSSAKNAMRVARTETNMAYRTADAQRWGQMDFVLGIEVKVSKHHEKDAVSDICDQLAGKYPKDFLFTGWHPQCRCYCTTILPNWSEIAKMEDAIDKGDKYIPDGMINDMPKGFNDWKEEHDVDIKKAKKNGKLPYFVRDNAGFFDIKGVNPANDVEFDGSSASSGVLKSLVGNSEKHLGVNEFDGNKDKQERIRKQALELFQEETKLKLTKLQQENLRMVAKTIGANLESPMSFVDADNGRTNPNYSLGGGNATNCQSCIAVFEMRLRGLNITTLPYNPKKDSVQFMLGEHFEQAWHKPKGGGTPKIEVVKNGDDDDLKQGLLEKTNQHGRYHIGFNTKTGKGHVVTLFKFSNNGIVIYDPQNNMFLELDDLKNIESFEILKVDKLLIRPNVLKEISKVVK